MYRLDNVTKSYRTARGEVSAVNGVSLVVDDGEWLAIQGPTGGGKSTLLQLLGALERPTTGTVELVAGGEPVRLDTLPERHLADVRARRIGFIFQGFNLIPTLSALDNVVAALRPIGVRGSEAVRRSREALGLVGLDDRADHLPASLSGGQQQRVAVARALVKSPDVLLADEPTGNLDERMRDDIVSLFEDVWREQRVTLIMVTHDSDVAARAERVITLEGGSVLTPTPR